MVFRVVGRRGYSVKGVLPRRGFTLLALMRLDALITCYLYCKSLLPVTLRDAMCPRPSVLPESPSF